MKTFNPTLTRLYQAVVVEAGLVETGTLRDSIKVYLYPQGQKLQIVIAAVDYHRYLYEPFNLIEKFEQRPEFSNEVSNAFAAYVEDRVSAMLNEEAFDFEQLDLGMEIDFEYIQLTQS